MPIVQAVGSASYGRGKRGKPRAAAIQSAMQQAILDAIARGVPVDDIKTMRSVQMAARQRILDEEK